MTESADNLHARACAMASRGDHAAAVKLWQRAADRGHAGALLRLGDAYHRGEGLAVSQTEARKHWQRGFAIIDQRQRAAGIIPAWERDNGPAAH